MHSSIGITKLNNKTIFNILNSYSTHSDYDVADIKLFQKKN